MQLHAAFAHFLGVLAMIASLDESAQWYERVHTRDSMPELRERIAIKEAVVLRAFCEISLEIESKTGL